MQAVWASQDRDGLREAIWLFLTERPTTNRRAKAQRLPYAFELWIAHLALLEQTLEMTPVSWRELRGTELEGLLLLRAAREQFRREYRACGECGAAVKGKICPRCGAVKQ
jgi:rubrerythrin